MTDPTLQSRYDDAAREIERLASECAAQRAELVRLRAELRLERAMREDAEGMVKVQCGELNKLNDELRTLRNCRTVGDDLGLKRHEWPEYRAESDSK